MLKKVIRIVVILPVGNECRQSIHFSVILVVLDISRANSGGLLANVYSTEVPGGISELHSTNLFLFLVVLVVEYDKN